MGGQRRSVVGLAVVVGVLTMAAGACRSTGGDAGPVGSGATSSTTTSGPPATAPPGDPYTYLEELADELGAEVGSRVDVANRATELCTLAVKDSLRAPLAELPADLAIVRSYCPEIEPAYRR